MGRKEQIVTTAARMFRERGYRNTSLQEIAAEVGIRKPSLYYFFPSKDDLLLEVVKIPVEWLNECLERIVASELDPQEQLRQAVLTLAASMDLYPDANSVFLREDNTDFDTPRARECIVAGKRRYVDLWKHIIAKGMTKGVFRRDVDLTVATYGAIEMVRGMVRWYRPGGRLSSSEIGEMYVKVILDGLTGTSDNRHPVAGSAVVERVPGVS